MSDLAARFQTAADDSKKLSQRPDNDTLLKLYASFDLVCAKSLKYSFSRS